MLEFNKKIIKIKNPTTGEWEQIPALQGEKGDKGDKGDNKVGYATCSTAADVAEKILTIADPNWKLEVGSMITVEHEVSNTASNVTLNVNGTGAYPIWYNGSEYTSTSSTYAGHNTRPITYLFNGTHWVWLHIGYYQSVPTNPSLGHGYGTCSTAEATLAKTCSISSYTLTAGGSVSIKFTNAVPANSTLNIRTRGAKKIFYKGSAITNGIIKAGDTATFVYDGTQYQLISIDRDYATKEYVDEAIESIDVTNQLTNYALKTELPTKTSQLTNDSGFITSIPSEYLTEQELSSKGLATETFVINKISKAQLGGREDDISNSMNNNLSLGVHSDGGIYLFVNGEPVGFGIFISNVEINVSDGYITDDNTIILSDNIPSGTYSVKYENEDDSYTVIGNFEI